MKKMEIKYTRINANDVIATSAPKCTSTNKHVYLYDFDNAIDFFVYTWNGTGWDRTSEEAWDLEGEGYGTFTPAPTKESWYVNTTGSNYVPCNDDHSSFNTTN